MFRRFMSSRKFRGAPPPPLRVWASRPGSPAEASGLRPQAASLVWPPSSPLVTLLFNLSHFFRAPRGHVHCKMHHGWPHAAAHTLSALSTLVSCPAQPLVGCPLAPNRRRRLISQRPGVAAEPVVVGEARGVALGRDGDALVVEEPGRHAPHGGGVDGVDARKHLSER